MNLISVTYFSIIYLILLKDETKTTLKAQCINLRRKAYHTTLRNVFSFNKITKIEVFPRVSGINYNCNFIFSSLSMKT